MSLRHGRFAFIQMIGTFISRLSGLFRLQVQGALLGAGRLNDVFNIAIMFPNLFRALMAEEAVKNSFVPVYKKYMNLKDPQALQALTRAFLGALFLTLTVVVALGIILAPYYVPLIAGGFDETYQALTVKVTRIIFPFVLIIGYAAVCMGVHYCRESDIGHWVTSMAPIAFNCGVILLGAVGFYYPQEAIFFLAGGVLVGAFCQWLVQVPAYLKGLESWSWRDLAPSWNLKNEGVKEIAGQWVPSVIGGAIVQVNVTVDRMIASYLGVGAVTAISYASRLLQLPVGLVGNSTAVSLHSTLSDRWATGDKEAFQRYLNWGIRYVAFFTLPIMAFFIVAAYPICRLLFEYGKFSAEGSARVALVLGFYSIGIFSYTLNRILKTSYSALQQNSTYAKVDLMTMFLNVALNLGTVFLLLQTGYRDVAFVGLAIGTSVSAIIQSVVLITLLKNPTRLTREFSWWKDNKREFGKILLSLVTMVGVLIGCQISLRFMNSSILGRIILLGVMGMGSGIAYIGVAVILKAENSEVISRRLKKLISKG